MPTTPQYGWPYQGRFDQPDGPALGERLALAIDATVKGIDVVAAAAAADLVNLDRILTAAAATVATSQTGAGTAYGDLATVGPAVTVTTGAKALVIVKCGYFNSGGNQTFMSFAVSGATTLAAADARAISIQSASQHHWGAAFLLTALTPGSNTFTAKYRVAAGTGTWADRDLIVIPL
jgi:hypothetical protein